MNELIEMLKGDREHYRQCVLSAFEYDMSDTSIKYYSNILTYIDSLIARVDARIKVGSE